MLKLNKFIIYWKYDGVKMLRIVAKHKNKEWKDENCL